MTYGDVSKQSPETQAAIEQEVRTLLKVCGFDRSPNIFGFSQFWNKVLEMFRIRSSLNAAGLMLLALLMLFANVVSIANNIKPV